MQLLVLASLISLSLVQHVHSSPPPVLEKRGCNQDNLLRNLEASSHLSDASTYCSALLSLPATSTVTTYTSTCVLSSYAVASTIIHPVYLFNFQPFNTLTPTPLSYNQASPTPSTIPGGAQSYDYPVYKRDMPRTPDVASHPTPTPAPPSPQELMRRDATLPSWLATTYPVSRLSSACSCLSLPAAATTTASLALFSITTTSTCTNYIPTTVATYPAICAPSLQVNAPQPASHSAYAIAPSFPVASKMDCCAACSNVFNCAWWKFDFGTVGDGWSPGTCHYAYFIGTLGELGYSNAPAVCPNGVTQGLSDTSGAQIGREANNNDPGYNSGPCGDAYNIFESNEDSGAPDDYYEHECYLNPPTSNPPGCA